MQNINNGKCLYCTKERGKNHAQDCPTLEKKTYLVTLKMFYQTPARDHKASNPTGIGVLVTCARWKRKSGVQSSYFRNFSFRKDW